MTTATESVSGWLSDFEAALDRRDIDGAAAMFAEESYWRDLVSFTWNIKTLEGRQEIADMLRAQLEDVQPSGFTLVGEANEADGITDGWFDFETAVARGHGHIRLKGNACWTLLTTMVELKGYEEKRLTAVRRASSTASSRVASHGWSASRPPSRRSATTSSRTA